MSKLPKKVQLVMLGGGGHARVLHALLVAAGQQLDWVCDPVLVAQGAQHWYGVPVLGADDVLLEYSTTEVCLINGIGQLVGESGRKALFLRFSDLGYCFPPQVHPSAWVAPGVILASGVQVMAGAVIQPNCSIGANTIINTRVGIDHDCCIGAHVHIAPNVTLCGNVLIGDGAFVGAGSTLIQSISVGSQAVIGAGTTLVRNTPDGARVLGTSVRLN